MLGKMAADTVHQLNRNTLHLLAVDILSVGLKYFAMLQHISSNVCDNILET